MTLCVRPFDPARTAELCDLWAESWRDAAPGIDFHARKPWLGGRIEAWTAAGAFCVLAVDVEDSLAGFILLDARAGLLDQICVRRDLKGSGAAQALMAEAKRLSPAGLVLDVNVMNGRAIRFYERQGFLRVGAGVNPTSGLPTVRYRWRP